MKGKSCSAFLPAFFGRVALGEDLAQGFNVHLGVDGGKFILGEGEELLDEADVGSAFQEVDGIIERWRVSRLAFFIEQA